MNRRQSRSGGRIPASPGIGLGELMAAAVQAQQRGRFAEALRLSRQAADLPGSTAEAKAAIAAASYNLGNAARRAGDARIAVAGYTQAIALQPGLVQAHGNLVRTLLSLGAAAPALAAAMAALRHAGSIELRRLFVRCARDTPLDSVPDGLAELVLQAFDGWGRSGDVARAAARILRLHPVIRRHGAALPEPWTPQDVAALAEDTLLLAHLALAPVNCGMLERTLTRLRAALLSQPDAPCPTLRIALARQCFANEYVFAADDAELAAADALRDRIETALQEAGPLAADAVATLAMYVPLHLLRGAGRLSGRGWPEPMAPLLRQQLDEPMQERALQGELPRLTPIQDATSLAVQRQYEENPYPRWAVADQVAPSTPLAFLRQSFPDIRIESPAMGSPVRILIAGCGTGQHAITTARRYPGAQILAVDLSLASLAYAQRKTVELGIGGIRYAQADLLALGASADRFDVIEASGVLHHLADPFAGWHVLLGLLRPGGFMRLGFYSPRGRRHVAAAKALIQARGLPPIPAGIRAAREMLATLPPGDGAGGVSQSVDFFSTSACRDLLFHVQEACPSLREIGDFMARAGLACLGFDVVETTRQLYRSRFPNDAGARDLASWDVFEQEHPDSFSGMYQFWVQSSGRSPGG